MKNTVGQASGNKAQKNNVTVGNAGRQASVKK